LLTGSWRGAIGGLLWGGLVLVFLSHHADPTSARHGVDGHQVDVAVGFISTFERLGWATRVQWPGQQRIEARRR
jgi:hypothetical protein